MKEDKASQVIVVGGGIAGLSVAYELFRRGISFTLLEAGSRAGGAPDDAELHRHSQLAGP